MSIDRPMGPRGRLGWLALLLSFGTMPVAAMEFEYRRPLVFAFGHIRNGDENAFKRLLAGLPQGEARGVVLSSGGGFVYAAGEIAREIRERGLATIVDAERLTCVSACTILFAGGVQRLYLNAGSVKDGVVSKAGRGLGFHEGSSALSRDANGYSGNGTAMVIGYLHEFGVPGAAALATKAPPEAIYMVSGQTALQTGLATRLGTFSPDGSTKKKGRR